MTFTLKSAANLEGTHGPSYETRLATLSVSLSHSHSLSVSHFSHTLCVIASYGVHMVVVKIQAELQSKMSKHH